MPLRKLLNKEKYQKRVKEYLSRLLDPALYEIPSDPVFVMYSKSSELVRLFSKKTLLECKRQNDISRLILKKGFSDPTGIALALESYKDEKPNEKKFRIFLQSLGNISGEEIINILIRIQKIIPLLSLPSFLKNSYLVSLTFLITDLKPHLNNFLIIFRDESSLNKTMMDLFIFFEKLFKKQSEIIALNHNLLMKKGRSLNHNEIICPYSREIICVSDSLRSENRAKVFLSLLIALCQLMQFQDEEIENFIAKQDIDYLKKAHDNLYDYLLHPKVYQFTPAQCQFLNEMGAEMAFKQIRYLKILKPKFNYLWKSESSFLSNVRSLLVNYSRANWRVPALGLFFNGDWNHHHTENVRKALLDLDTGTPVIQVLNTLKTTIQKKPEFNEEGKLIKMLAFIEYKLNKLPLQSDHPPLEKKERESIKRVSLT